MTVSLAQLNVMSDVRREVKVIPPRLPRGCTAEEISVKQVNDHGIGVLYELLQQRAGDQQGDCCW